MHPGWVMSQLGNALNEAGRRMMKLDRHPHEAAAKILSKACAVAVRDLYGEEPGEVLDQAEACRAFLEGMAGDLEAMD